MLNVSNMCVRYGELTIVNDVSFSVSCGDFFMLVGPNGAGKSTILSALAGGTRFFGSAGFLGRELSSMPPRERARCIGLLGQNHFVGYDFTVEEVVRLGRYAYGRNDDNASRMVLEAIESVGLADKRAQSVTTLSGGELQRTFLAQVLAQDPKLLLLDEPANHLDLIYQKELFTLLGSWLLKGDRAVLAVVHDLSLARRFGTKALLLDRGHAAAQGEIRNVLNPEALDAVYGLDVQQWMRELYAPWEEA